MATAFDLAAGCAWALPQENLLTVMRVAARLGEDPQALATRLGRPLENTRSVEMHDGVAVVPLIGPMFRYANLMTEHSGATSTDAFAKDFQAAIDDPAVRAVVLDISSPGGEAEGINEMASVIYQARGVKPIVAYVGGTAASGAYWIASAADRIVMDAIAMVGSIGVVTRYATNPDRPGVTVTEIVSSQSPNKNLSPETEAGRAAIQKTVDAMATVFVESVARHRGVSAAHVLEHFGRGGMEVGADAVRLGMADSLGSLNSVLAGLSGRSRPGMSGLTSIQQGKATMAQENPAPTETVVAAPPGIQPEQITAAFIVERFPTVAATLRQDGATGERTRILGIQEASLPGFGAVMSAAIADGSSPEAFALAQAKAQKAAGSAHLAALSADEKALAALKPDAAPVPAAAKPAIDPNLPLADRIKAEWEGSPTIRAEFGGTFESYAAYRQADAAGLVKHAPKKG